MPDHAKDGTPTAGGTVKQHKKNGSKNPGRSAADKVAQGAEEGGPPSTQAHAQGGTTEGGAPTTEQATAAPTQPTQHVAGSDEEMYEQREEDASDEESDKTSEVSSAELQPDAAPQTDVTEHIVMTPSQLQEMMDFRLKPYMGEHVSTLMGGMVKHMTKGQNNFMNRLEAWGGRRP